MNVMQKAIGVQNNSKILENPRLLYRIQRARLGSIQGMQMIQNKRARKVFWVFFLVVVVGEKKINPAVPNRIKTSIPKHL